MLLAFNKLRAKIPGGLASYGMEYAMGMVIGARIAGCQNTTFQKPVVHDCNHTCNYKFATGDLHGQQLNE